MYIDSLCSPGDLQAFASWRGVNYFSQNFIIFSEDVIKYGECSVTVAQQPVALLEGVRLSPFALGEADSESDYFNCEVEGSADEVCVSSPFALQT
jgi:hypothetical protein